jgi:hypothetical protein
LIPGSLVAFRLNSHIALAEINDPLFSRAANAIINNLPEMKKSLLEALDLIFIPKQIASQFVLAVALETSMVGKCGVIWFGSFSFSSCVNVVC